MLALLLLGAVGVVGVEAGLTHPPLLPLPFPPSYKAAPIPTRGHTSETTTYNLEPLPHTYNPAASPYNLKNNNRNAASISYNPPLDVYESPVTDFKPSSGGYEASDSTHNTPSSYNQEDNSHNPASISYNHPPVVYEFPSDPKSSGEGYDLGSTLNTPSVGHNPPSSVYKTISVVYDSPNDDIDLNRNDFISSVIKLGLSFGGYKDTDTYSPPVNEYITPVIDYEAPGEHYSPSDEDYNPLSSDYSIPSSDYETQFKNNNLQSATDYQGPQDHKPQPNNYNLSSSDHSIQPPSHNPQLETYIHLSNNHSLHSTNYNPGPKSFRPQYYDYNPSSNDHIQQPTSYNPESNGHTPQTINYSPQSNSHNPLPNNYRSQSSNQNLQSSSYTSKANDHNQPLNHNQEPKSYKPQSNNHSLHFNTSPKSNTHSLQHKTHIPQAISHNPEPMNLNHQPHHHHAPTSNPGHLFSPFNTHFKFHPSAVPKHRIIDTNYGSIGGGAPSTTAYSFPTSRGSGGAGGATGYSSAQITIGSTKPKFRFSKADVTSLRTYRGYRTPLARTPTSTIIYKAVGKGSKGIRTGVTLPKRPSGIVPSSSRHHLRPLATATTTPDEVVHVSTTPAPLVTPPSSSKQRVKPLVTVKTHPELFIHASTTPKPHVNLPSSSRQGFQPLVTTTTRPELVIHASTTPTPLVSYPATPRPARTTTTPERKVVTVPKRPNGTFPSSSRHLLKSLVTTTTRPETVPHASTNSEPLVLYPTPPRPATTTAGYSTTPKSHSYESGPVIVRATLAYEQPERVVAGTSLRSPSYNDVGRSRNRIALHNDNQVDGQVSHGVQVIQKGAPGEETTPTPAPSSLDLVHGTHGGSEYHFSWQVYPNQRYTWAEADRYCATLGSTWQLVSLESQEEHLYVSNSALRGKIGSSWTGGYREPWSRYFAWMSGEPFSGHSWSRGGRSGMKQPDNKEGNEYFISLVSSPHKDGMKWHDSPNRERKASVCERKKMVKEDS